MAKNPQTSAEVLRMLAQDEVKDLWWVVAQHPQTPVEALQLLAQNEDSWVRRTVARHASKLGEICNDFEVSVGESARNIGIAH